MQLLMMLCSAAPRHHGGCLSQVGLSGQSQVQGNLVVFSQDDMERATWHICQTCRAAMTTLINKNAAVLSIQIEQCQMYSSPAMDEKQMQYC